MLRQLLRVGTNFDKQRPHGWGGVPALFFLLILAVLVAGGILGTLNARRLIRNDRQVAHTDDAIVELATLLSTLEDAETGQRGYLLTGDETYLQPYHAATERLETELSRLRDVESDAQQRVRLAVLDRTIRLKLDELERTIALEKAGDHAAALGIVRSNVGKAHMDAIRTQVAAMQSAEHDLLARQAAESERSSRTAIVTIIGPALIGTFLLCLVFLLTARTLRLERRAGDALSAERERLRVTLASIGDAVLSTDGDGRIAFVNPVAEAVTGWSSVETIGQPLEAVFRIINEQTRAAVENPAQRAVREGAIVGLANHTILVRKDGTECPIEDSAAPIRDAEGHIVGCVLVFRDVSERRRIERQRYDLLLELKTADRQKDEFLALLAHELRGPLAPLRNSVEILKRADADEMVRQHAQMTMERQLGHLVRLVNDLLDVARIARGQIELRREPVDIRAIAQQAVETCRPVAASAGHTIEVSLPEAPLYIDGDAARLAQVLGNLVHNACKYTEPGGRIELTLTREHSEAVIRVKDTGVGIPPERLDEIFDLFVQLDHTRERAQGGLGVGLAVVKRLVKMHGGSVAASSEGLGRGSEFVVRLAIEASRTPTESEVSAEGSVSSRRILVVDDNPDTAMSLSILLESTGHEAHTANDGLEALTMAEKLQPDVILLDIGLPKLNGYEVCRRVREQPWAKNIIVIAVTGWGQEEDRRKSTEAGFDAHLVKPPELAVLMRLIAGAS